MTRAIHCVLLALVPLLSLGCGYSTQSSLDPKYQTIYVEAVFDQTDEYGLQAPLSNAITRKFITDSRLKVVKQEQADLHLQGVILDYKRKGLTFGRDDEVTQFLLAITAGVRITDQNSGEVLWQEEIISGETTYYTRAAGQSSDRLRGNAEVFLPTVTSFASEEENRAASEALKQLASDIFYRTVEPW